MLAKSHRDLIQTLHVLEEPFPSSLNATLREARYNQSIKYYRLWWELVTGLLNAEQKVFLSIDGKLYG